MYARVWGINLKTKSEKKRKEEEGRACFLFDDGRLYILVVRRVRACVRACALCGTLGPEEGRVKRWCFFFGDGERRVRACAHVLVEETLGLTEQLTSGASGPEKTSVANEMANTSPPKATVAPTPTCCAIAAKPSGKMGSLASSPAPKASGPVSPMARVRVRVRACVEGDVEDADGEGDEGREEATDAFRRDVVLRCVVVLVLAPFEKTTFLLVLVVVKEANAATPRGRVVSGEASFFNVTLAPLRTMPRPPLPEAQGMARGRGIAVIGATGK
jgi:hypothetical protein